MYFLTLLLFVFLLCMLVLPLALISKNMRTITFYVLGSILCGPLFLYELSLDSIMVGLSEGTQVKASELMNEQEYFSHLGVVMTAALLVGSLMLLMSAFLSRPETSGQETQRRRVILLSISTFVFIGCNVSLALFRTKYLGYW